MAAQRSRSERRKGYPVDLHLEALDDDQDRLDAGLNDIRRAQSRTNTYLLGLMGSLMVAAVMLAVNVVVLG